MSVDAGRSSRLRWHEYALALLPLPLVATGAIGLAVGPAACAANLALMRLRLPTIARGFAVLVTTVVAFATWAVLARGLDPGG
jgi:hypothetical protein